MTSPLSASILAGLLARPEPNDDEKHDDDEKRQTRYTPPPYDPDDTGWRPWS